MKKNIWEMDVKLFENILVILSILFILGCIGFYGNRFIKYYKVYNPKTESGEKVEVFSTTIRKANPVISENDGLYMHNGDFVFKGEDVNNYVSLNNRIWRVVRVYRTGAVRLILDEALTEMSFGNEGDIYKDSLVYNYINDENNLKINKNLLQPMTVCLDKIDDISSITCEENLSDQYVSLPGISDYINSLNEESYMNNVDNMWFYSLSSDFRAWSLNDKIVSVDDIDYEYSVKVVITLKGSVYSKSGNGSIGSPYVIEESV